MGSLLTVDGILVVYIGSLSVCVRNTAQTMWRAPVRAPEVTSGVKANAFLSARVNLHEQEARPRMTAACRPGQAPVSRTWRRGDHAAGQRFAKLCNDPEATPNLPPLHPMWHMRALRFCTFTHV